MQAYSSQQTFITLAAKLLKVYNIISREMGKFLFLLRLPPQKDVFAG